MVVTGPNLGESCHARWLHCIAAQWLTASGRERQTVAPHYYYYYYCPQTESCWCKKKTNSVFPIRPWIHRPPWNGLEFLFNWIVDRSEKKRVKSLEFSSRANQTSSIGSGLKVDGNRHLNCLLPVEELTTFIVYNILIDCGSIALNSGRKKAWFVLVSRNEKVTIGYNWHFGCEHVFIIKQILHMPLDHRLVLFFEQQNSPHSSWRVYSKPRMLCCYNMLSLQDGDNNFRWYNGVIVTCVYVLLLLINY